MKNDKSKLKVIESILFILANLLFAAFFILFWLVMRQVLTDPTVQLATYIGFPIACVLFVGLIVYLLVKYKRK